MISGSKLSHWDVNCDIQVLSCDFVDHLVHPDIQHQDVKVLHCEKELYNFDPYVTL